MATEKTNATADATTTATATVKKTKLVDLFIPRGSSVDEPNVIIGINGKNYVLPKGKTSNVPASVKYEYERSVRAREAMDVRAAEMVERAAEQEKNPVGT